MEKNKKHDYAVVIGRFQPAHYGHEYLIQSALDAGEQVIVVIGSANQAPDIQNPFTDNERTDFIRAYLSDECEDVDPDLDDDEYYEMYGKLKPCSDMDRTHFVFVEDRSHQNALWISDVYSEVQKKIRNTSGWKDKDPSVVLVGHKKDQSSWYLDAFKQWDYQDSGHLQTKDQKTILHATDIRELIFRDKLTYIENAVHPYVFDYIKRWKSFNIGVDLQQQYEDAVAYEKNFSSIPESWTRNFVTADAVVIQSGHVLLVQRGVNPGKGLWALPGGHVDANEFVLDTAVRELSEETNIKVPEKVIRGSLREMKLFENPDRSIRCRVTKKNGRTYTFAHLFWLSDKEKLPRVKGGDDAMKAWWVPIGEAMTVRHKMFEDHYDILNYFIHSHDIC